MLMSDDFFFFEVLYLIFFSFGFLIDQVSLKTRTRADKTFRQVAWDRMFVELARANVCLIANGKRVE